MRRKDREVRDPDGVFDIVKNCRTVHLGMVDGGKPYVVAMNFGWDRDGDSLILYFHSAQEGRKIDALAASPQVAFEMDGGHQLVAGKAPCSYSFRYASITGTGTAVFCRTAEEKIAGLQAIMAHQTGQTFSFTREMVQNVAVFRVEADTYTAKARRG